jgi:hypothetical protein
MKFPLPCIQNPKGCQPGNQSHGGQMMWAY